MTKFSISCVYLTPLKAQWCSTRCIIQPVRAVRVTVRKSWNKSLQYFFRWKLKYFSWRFIWSVPQTSTVRFPEWYGQTAHFLICQQQPTCYATPLPSNGRLQYLHFGSTGKSFNSAHAVQLQFLFWVWTGLWNRGKQQYLHSIFLLSFESGYLPSLESERFKVFHDFLKSRY